MGPHAYLHYGPDTVLEAEHHSVPWKLLSDMKPEWLDFLAIEGDN